MTKRAIPKAFKTPKGDSSKGHPGRRIRLIDGPCAGPESFFRTDAKPGVELRIPIPRSLDCTSYVEHELGDDRVWTYKEKR